MTSKLTREWLQDRIANMECYGVVGDEALILQAYRMALAAMDSEPNRNPVLAYADSYRDMAKQGVESVPIWSVITDLERNIAPLYRHAQPAKGLELAGWQFKSVNGDWLGLIDEHGKNQAVREGCEVREVFAMADDVNDRDQVRSEHAEWSQATFGNVGPVGPLKHLSKEALEAAAEPDDLSEWADMQFLLWDAQRRAGITDEQITQAMIEKLTVNKQREWPEPKDGEPRLHIKELPAPVVMDDIKLRELFDSWFASDCSFDRSPEASEEDNIAWRESYWYVWQRCRAAMLQVGSSPVIPEGYVMVPKEPTEDMVIAGFESRPDEDFSKPEVWEEYQNMSGCQQAAHRARLCWAAMLSAAQQEVKGE